MAFNKNIGEPSSSVIESYLVHIYFDTILNKHYSILVLLEEEFLQTSTDPGFLSIRLTRSSVIGSISGLIVPDTSSEP